MLELTGSFSYTPCTVFNGMSLADVRMLLVLVVTRPKPRWDCRIDSLSLSLSVQRVWSSASASHSRPPPSCCGKLRKSSTRSRSMAVPATATSTSSRSHCTLPGLAPRALSSLMPSPCACGRSWRCRGRWAPKT